MHEKPRVELFCPVPQMVGGGTVHWQGWLPRFTPNDFRLRTVAGELKGASLADWPITYAELEPYYAKVEWAFVVSGQAGANLFEGPRSKGYPCPPLPVSRYAEKFHKGCEALGWNSFPTPQAALSRAFNGRRPTVIGAFAQQHGDPTGTRSSALNVFVPDALKTGRFDLRPDAYVRELTLHSSGKIKSAIYEDATATSPSRKLISSFSPAGRWSPRASCSFRNPAASREGLRTALILWDAM